LLIRIGLKSQNPNPRENPNPKLKNSKERARVPAGLGDWDLEFGISTEMASTSVRVPGFITARGRPFLIEHRRQADEDDPGNVFRIVDPHRFKIPNPKSQGKSKSQIEKFQRARTPACRPWGLGFGV
jgi:hypothetical protein